MIFGWGKQTTNARKLVVGLGNPGKKYAKTRHNIGFQVVARVARQYGDGKPKKKFKGEIVDAMIQGVRVSLLLPHTFMNLSGSSVQPALAFYQLTVDQLLVVCDDFSLSLAKLRFRGKGSSGGQKGLGDIIRKLGTDQFSRLRIGIGPPPDNWDVTDYVLSSFSSQETEQIEESIQRAACGIVDWVQHGTAYCMNEYNGK